MSKKSKPHKKRSDAELKAVGKNVECRHFTTTFEKRGDGESEGRTIYGYAAVFNRETNMGWYTEVIETGAFDEAINNSDCRALFNHDPDHLLARQSSNTLQLNIDKTGLAYEFVSPETSIGNDILVMIGRGDLKESSFAFTIEEQVWEETQTEDGWEYKRIIKKVKELFDIAPVTYPAYGDTSVAKRSFDTWREEKPKSQKRYTTQLIDNLVKQYEVAI